jgi:hypothetical protein
MKKREGRRSDTNYSLEEDVGDEITSDLVYVC